MAKMKVMTKLRDYLNSLSTEEQADLAQRCETSVGFLRKAISIKQDISAETVIALERETNGEVRCEDLRPDIDWHVLRNTAA
jgi:DNA-binding transcriptional regulator YdaS (Cro superfamily)